MRASALVLGPLLARFKMARVSLPGGCAIGARPINLHLMALEKMGADIKIEKGYVITKAERLKGARIYFDISTVTGTENIMMAAALADCITIEGGERLKPVIHTVMPDRIEAGTFMVASGMTKGDILIENCPIQHLEALATKLRETGMEIEIENNGVRATGHSLIKSVDVKTLPYPGFPTDMQAQMMAMMCIANGLSF